MKKYYGQKRFMVVPVNMACVARLEKIAKMTGWDGSQIVEDAIRNYRLTIRGLNKKAKE